MISTVIKKRFYLQFSHIQTCIVQGCSQESQCKHLHKCRCMEKASMMSSNGLACEVFSSIPVYHGEADEDSQESVIAVDSLVDEICN